MGRPTALPMAGSHGLPYGGSMGERPRVMHGQFHVTRDVTEDAYLVRILVGDGKTDEVQVTPLEPVPGHLPQRRRPDPAGGQAFDEGRGYQRSFSYTQGAVSRRLGLPPDADLSGMTREVSNGTITLRVPRTARRVGDPGMDPDSPHCLVGCGKAWGHRRWPRPPRSAPAAAGQP